MKMKTMILASAAPFVLPEAWKKKLAASARPLEVRADGEEAEILIYDQIGEGMFSYGVTAKDFVQKLRDIGNKPVNVRLNSPGGDVFDGMAIYNAMKAHPSPVRCTVDGLAASIASIIAMGGTKCTMADNSMMMIHNPAAITMGDAEELRKTADLLDKVKGQMVDTYVAKSGMGKRETSTMMDEETWLTAKECMDKGLCDEVTTGSQVSAKFDFSILGFKHVPEQLKAEEKPAVEPPAPEGPTPGQIEEEKQRIAAQVENEQLRERMKLALA
jgi:ATP-dependent Clp protease protease subunit